MQAEQEQFAAQIREVPITFHKVLRTDDDSAIRHRPASGEWSAIEVLGHMIDKMYHAFNRVERVLNEERPLLLVNDQDAEVRTHDYQNADPLVLQKVLKQQCEQFATLVASIPSASLLREGVHSENGVMTLRQCIQAPLNSVPGHLEQLHKAQTVR